MSLNVIQVFDNLFKDNTLTNLFQQANRNVPLQSSITGDKLSQSAIDYYYYKNRILQKIVESKPLDGTKYLPQVIDPNNVIDTEQLFTDFREIKSYGQPLEEIDSLGAIAKTGIYGNMYGDGMLFLGIDDGLLPNEPVDINRIRGISWMVARHRFQVGINYTQQGYWLPTVEASRETTEEAHDFTNMLFHHTRVVRIPGVKLHGQALNNNGGYNSSILDSVFREFDNYCETIVSASRMIHTHSLFKYKLQGLSEMLINGREAALRRRFEGIMSSLDVLGGLVYDAGDEEAEFMDRTYSGADKLIELIIQWFVAAADMPVSKIFGTPGSAALSESGKSEERLWNESVNQYQTNKLSPGYYKIFTYLLAARNNYNSFGLAYPLHYPISEREQAETRRLNAIADKIYYEISAASGIPLEQVLETYSNLHTKETFSN